MSTRYDVVTPVKYMKGSEEKTTWSRCGSAWQKENGTWSIVLDSIPLNGKLMVVPPRDPRDKKNERTSERRPIAEANPSPAIQDDIPF